MPCYMTSLQIEILFSFRKKRTICLKFKSFWERGGEESWFVKGGKKFLNLRFLIKGSKYYYQGERGELFGWLYTDSNNQRQGWARYRNRAGHVTGLGLGTLQDQSWARYRTRAGHVTGLGLTRYWIRDVTGLGLDTLQDQSWARYRARAGHVKRTRTGHVTVQGLGTLHDQGWAHYRTRAEHVTTFLIRSLMVSKIIRPIPLKTKVNCAKY